MASRQPSIRHKILSAIMLASATALTLTVAAFMFYDYVSTRRMMSQNLSARAHDRADASVGPLAFKKEREALDKISDWRGNTHIVAAALYDEQGRLFVRYPTNAPVAEFPAHPPKKGVYFSQSKLVAFETVEQGDSVFGTVY